VTTFDELGLIPPLLEAVRARGFETPTPIQAEMIPFVLNSRRDVTGLAQTGTGKTAAFGLPILQTIDPTLRRTQALILAPTRELGLQVSRDLADFGSRLAGLRSAVVYGGAAFGPQIRELKAGAQVITATPGRLKDLLDRGIADLSALRFLVLDEADQMLDMGFKDDLDAILAAAGPERQTLLFSATMPPEVARIAATYMTDPHEIVAGERNRGAANVRHIAYRVHAGDKYAALKRLIDVHPGMYGIIFGRTRDTVKEVARKLAADGYAADALHGELSQIQRESVMRRFRLGNPSLLVATDVAARGLDVDDLTHVLHYDLPDEIAAYTHRSGRTGRAGKSGTSLALVHLREGHKIPRIERVLGRPIEFGRIPGGAEVCRTRMDALVQDLGAVDAEDEALEPYLEMARKAFEGWDRDELLRHVVARDFRRFLKEYAAAPDLNPPPPPKRHRRDVVGGMVTLRINLGRRQGILPPQIIGLVNRVTRTRSIRLGRIDINTDRSDVQVEASMVDRVERALRGADHHGVRIRVERLRTGGHHPRDRKSRTRRR